MTASQTYELFLLDNPPRLKSFAECNRVLRNYESKIVKSYDGCYVINLDFEHIFTRRQDVLDFCRFTFWQRNMHAGVC